MNRQDVFDYVCQHLLKQGKKSMTSTVYYQDLNCKEFCAYRSDDGASMCAIGCLIREEDYRTYIEGQSVVDSEEVQAMLRNNGVDIDNALTMHILGRLQVIHDELQTRDWGRALAELAKECKLKYFERAEEK